MYISSILKKEGLELDLVKAGEDYRGKTLSFKPDIIGYSVITGSQKNFLKINSELKNIHKFISVMGGPHPTFFPEVINDKDVDYVIRGEGEVAVVKFIKFLKNEISIKEVPNLSYKQASRISHNSLAPLLDNLDNLPFPDRDIFFKYDFIKQGPIKHFMATRGCPFKCSYCFNEKYFELYKNLGNRVRYRSVDNVIKEIEMVVNSSPTKIVYFQDDTFTLNKNWLAEFSEKYKKGVNLPLHCHVRANKVDAEKVQMLKDANCISVHIAAESGDDYLRNEVLQRNMKYDEIVNAMDLFRKSNIKTMMQNMLGLPGGNFKSDLATLKLNIRCKPTYAWVSIYQPYPGTPLADYAIQKGFFDGNYEVIDNNFFNSTVLKFSKSYKKKIENLQKVFALIVKFPVLYYLGIFRFVINLPRTAFVKRMLGRIYRKLRRTSDFLLYGIKLSYE